MSDTDKKKRKRRYRLRNLEVDRVDLVDRGANQHSHVVIAKSRDKSGMDRAAAEKIIEELRRRRKKGAKGTAFPERMAEEVSDGYAKAFPPQANPKKKPNPFAKPGEEEPEEDETEEQPGEGKPEEKSPPPFGQKPQAPQAPQSPPAPQPGMTTSSLQSQYQQAFSPFASQPGPAMAGPPPAPQPPPAPMTPGLPGAPGAMPGAMPGAPGAPNPMAPMQANPRDRLAEFMRQRQAAVPSFPAVGSPAGVGGGPAAPGALPGQPGQQPPAPGGMPPGPGQIPGQIPGQTPGALPGQPQPLANPRPGIPQTSGQLAEMLQQRKMPPQPFGKGE